MSLKSSYNKLILNFLFVGFLIIPLISTLAININAETNVSNSYTPNFESDSTPPTVSNLTHDPTIPDNTQTVNISCSIYDSSGLNDKKVYYQFEGTGTWNYADMLQIGSTNYYYAIIGPFVAGSSIEYYIYAQDASTSHNMINYNNDSNYFSFSVVDADQEGPIITQIEHTPSAPVEGEDVIISCNIVDDSTFYANVVYRYDYGDWNYIIMSYDTGDSYYANISNFSFQDFVQYYITATDDAYEPNTAIADAGGLYYSFTVGELDIQGPVIDGVYFLPEQPVIGVPITIYCNVTDDLNDVLFVRIFFRLDGGTWSYFTMQTENDKTYTVELAAFENSFLVEFYFIANDTAPNQNTAINNNGGSYFSFTILEDTGTANINYLVPIIAIASVSIFVILRRKNQ